MKTKSFSKKLVLNKKTIVNLDYKQLSKVHGGGTLAGESCDNPCMPDTLEEECPDHTVDTCTEDTVVCCRDY